MKYFCRKYFEINIIPALYILLKKLRGVSKTVKRTIRSEKRGYKMQRTCVSLRNRMDR